MTAVKSGLLLIVFLFQLTCLTGMATAADDTLMVYAGRSKSLVEPLIERFTKETGIKVQVRYAGTTQLALALIQEGGRSPADVFWAQDTGALELLTEKGLFIKLPDDLTTIALATFRSANQTWVATSARGRTLAYAPSRVSKEQLPASVFELTDPKWKGRIGWAPANASFQAFVTGMRTKYGEDKTRAWLTGVRDNQPKAYPRNSPIIDALAAGEVDLGLLNHYYLLKTKAAKKDYPVEQTTFAQKGDMGNLLFVAGAGVLKSSKNQAVAQRFLRFLLSESSQTFFTTDVFEYPVIEGVETLDVAPAREAAPELPYADLSDLDGTLKMLRELGLL